jgi:hypothetical protein
MLLTWMETVFPLSMDEYLQPLRDRIPAAGFQRNRGRFYPQLEGDPDTRRVHGGKVRERLP